MNCRLGEYTSFSVVSSTAREKSKENGVATLVCMSGFIPLWMLIASLVSLLPVPIIPVFVREVTLLVTIILGIAMIMAILLLTTNTKMIIIIIIIPPRTITVLPTLKKVYSVTVTKTPVPISPIVTTKKYNNYLDGINDNNNGDNAVENDSSRKEVNVSDVFDDGSEIRNSVEQEMLFYGCGYGESNNTDQTNNNTNHKSITNQDHRNKQRNNNTVNNNNCQTNNNTDNDRNTSNNEKKNNTVNNNNNYQTNNNTNYQTNSNTNYQTNNNTNNANNTTANQESQNINSERNNENNSKEAKTTPTGEAIDSMGVWIYPKKILGMSNKFRPNTLSNFTFKRGTYRFPFSIVLPSVPPTWECKYLKKTGFEQLVGSIDWHLSARVFKLALSRSILSPLVLAESPPVNVLFVTPQALITEGFKFSLNTPRCVAVNSFPLGNGHNSTWTFTLPKFTFFVGEEVELQIDCTQNHANNTAKEITLEIYLEESINFGTRKALRKCPGVKYPNIIPPTTFSQATMKYKLLPSYFSSVKRGPIMIWPRLSRQHCSTKNYYFIVVKVSSLYLKLSGKCKVVSIPVVVLDSPDSLCV